MAQRVKALALVYPMRPLYHNLDRASIRQAKKHGWEGAGVTPIPAP